MKKILILGLTVFIFTACGASSQTTVNTNAVPPPATRSTNETLVVSSHQTDKPAPTNPANSSSPSTQSPNSMAIDVTEMTAKIEKADKELKAKPADAKAKENLAAA